MFEETLISQLATIEKSEHCYKFDDVVTRATSRTIGNDTPIVSIDDTDFMAPAYSPESQFILILPC